MATFSELLTKYTERTGIADAELARSVGVRRQTIFRWKEGLVGRPRHREDVLKCAQRLRLSPEEQDKLLLAAGFPSEPKSESSGTHADSDSNGAVDAKGESPPTAFVEATPAEAPSQNSATYSATYPGAENDVENDVENNVGNNVEEDKEDDVESQEPKTGQTPTQSFSPSIPLPQSRFYIGAAVLLLLGSIIATLLWNPRPLPDWLRATLPAAPTTTRDPSVQAAAGENLLLVAQFRNYTPNLNYNVSGRLQEALQTQVDLVEIENVRVAQWPEAMETAEQARTTLNAAGATMMVWGEYDSGRVLVHFTTHDPTGTAAGSAIDAEMERHLPSPADLSTTINVDVPQQVRGLALLTLGRLYRSQGDWERARVAMEEALALDLPDSTRETAYFYLGTIYTQSVPADLERAIDAYTNALALRPNDANALYNRGKLYLERYQLASGSSGSQDLTLALDDLSRTIELKPQYAAAYNNRGIAYYLRKRTGDVVRALADLDRAVALDAEAIEYRYNRALGHIRLDNADAWQEDLEWVLARSPEYNSARVALCWGHALDQQPERALAHCQAALEREPDRHDVYDSLGIVYAEQGDLESAIQQFQAYLAWLDELPASAYEQYNGPLIESWIQSLEAGSNPIDTAALNALR